MTFKEKLVILRKSKGLTQDEFASFVGVSRQAVYKWECGQSYPEVPKLLEMKLLFNITIDELLDDSIDIPVPEKKKRTRISKEAKEKIEQTVEKQIKIARPKAEPKPKAEPAPAVKAETVNVPKVDFVPEIKSANVFIPNPNEPAVDVVTPNVVTPDMVVNNEPAKPAAEEETAKKGGLFGRFFGRK